MVDHLVRPVLDGRLHQGDVLRAVDIPIVHGFDGEQPLVTFFPTPWAVVTSQECDLQQDHAARFKVALIEGRPPVSPDKVLRAVLLLPGWPADEVLAGTHDPSAQPIRGQRQDIVRRNEVTRYYHLRSQEGLIDEPVIFDFKWFSTIPASFAEERWMPKRVATIATPWRDEMTRQFLSYMGRVAVDDD